MKEIFEIIKAFDAAVEKGLQSALATVVKVEGSSYRRPGARMLITEDGQLTGAISGGCLEGDALRRALLVMQQQQPKLATYDTTDEDDAKIGIQLGCNGIVHILIEPVKNEPENAIDLLKIIAAKRQNAVIATLFSLSDKNEEHAGTYALLTDKSSCYKALPEELIFDMQNVLEQKCSAEKEYGNKTVLIEYVPPSLSLIIFGAGNDAVPMVQMASVLGWQITVIDGRSNYATRKRFPQAQQIVVAKPGEVMNQIAVDDKTAVVLMTHNYNYDIAMLQQLLPLRLPYIGTLGPKTKLQRMMNELTQKGISITDNQRQCIYGPTGLDIGAETAEEIALSVLSEIKTVISGTNGKSLRKKQTTIHANH